MFCTLHDGGLPAGYLSHSGGYVEAEPGRSTAMGRRLYIFDVVLPFKGGVPGQWLETEENLGPGGKMLV